MSRSTLPLALISLLSLTAASSAEGPQVVASGPWSKPVADDRGYALRGRLVLCEKVVAPDRREVAMYVELQDACDFIGLGMQVYCELSKTNFRPEYKGGLQCEMRDKEGTLIEPQGFPFGGGVPRNQWVMLPTDGTIRLRTTPFGIHRPGALAVCPDLRGMWIITDDDTNEYLLSGTFSVDPPADQKAPDEGLHAWRGTLQLPAMQIFSRGVTARAQ